MIEQLILCRGWGNSGATPGSGFGWTHTKVVSKPLHLLWPFPVAEHLLGASSFLPDLGKAPQSGVLGASPPLSPHLTMGCREGQRSSQHPHGASGTESPSPPAAVSRADKASAWTQIRKLQLSVQLSRTAPFDR